MSGRKISIRLLSSLLLCCLLLIGCRPPEQPIVQPPDQPAAQPPDQPAVQPPEQRFSVPEPWQPTGRLPWKLTDSEKAKVVDIFLNTPEVSEWLQNQERYRISKIEWYALWDGGMGGMGKYSEEKVEDLKVGAPGGPPNEADFYPGLTIIGDERNLQIAIDLTLETAVYILGPYPPLGPPAESPPTSE